MMYKKMHFAAYAVMLLLLALHCTAMASSGEQNVALGKPAEAYDSAFFMDGGNYWSQYIPSRAVDGDAENVKSRWNSSSLNKKGPQSLEVDLEGYYIISSCRITLTAAIDGFSIQYWDGSWQDIQGGKVSDTMASGLKAFDIDFIKPEITNKVRFYYPHDTSVSMLEFEVYGTPVPQDMLSKPSAFADVSDAKLTTALKLLSSLRILGGMEDGNYHPEQSVNRAQFIKTVIKALDRDTLASGYNEPVSYRDVDPDSSFYGYISLASSLGLISTDAESFRPNDSILAEEAIAITVRALGYEMIAQKNGGYTVGYLSTADKLKLLSQGRYMVGKPLTREDMAFLIFNMLKSNPLTLTIPKGNTVAYEISDEDMLSDVYDIHRATGYVRAIGDMALPGSDAPGGSNIVIDGASFSTDITDRELLGQKVEYYWHKSDAGDSVIMLEPTDGISVLRIKAEDITTDTNANTIYYYEGSRSKHASISPMADVYVNGILKFDYNKDDLCPADGVVVLVDSDSDGKYDVVHAREFAYIVVRNVDTLNEKINGLYNDTFSYDGIKYTMMQNGKYIGFDALESDTVLRIEQVDRNYYDIEASNDVIEGKVTGIRLDGTDTFAALNGEEYKISEYYRDKYDKGIARKAIAMNASGKFYLSSNGVICAFKGGSTDSVYGFLVKAYEEEGDSGIGYFEIIDNNNEHITFKRENKLLTNVIYGQTRADASAVASKLNKKPQLVKYKTNADGELTELYSAVEVTGEEKNLDELPFISYNRTGSSSLYLTPGGYLSKEYTYTDDSVFYSVALKDPNLGLSYDNIDKDEIKCFSLKMPDLRPYRIILYDFNPNGDHRIGAGVVFSNWIVKYSENRFNTIDGSLDTNMAIFLSKSEMLDLNGDKTYRIKCLYKGAETTFPVKSGDVLDDMDVQLEKGDLFFPETIGEQISYIWFMYDFSERAYDRETYTDPAFITSYLNSYNFRNSWYKTMGAVGNYADNIITLDYGSNGFPYKLPKDTRVYIYRNSDFYTGTIADIHKGDYIILNCNGVNSADILIIRGE